MKRFALLVLCVLASGCIAQRCGNTPAFTPESASNEFRAGASSVPTLNIRNTAAAAEIFKDRYITIHNDYGQVIGSTDVSQMVDIGQNLIAAIEGDYARLENSIKQTPNKSVRSAHIDKDLEQINEQVETFMKLKPGTQTVKSNLRDMPPKPEFKSDNKNLTASQAFLHLAETIDGEWYAVGEYARALHWYGWRRVRTFFDLLQTQIRNQILNDTVLPVYRTIVDEVYSQYKTIQKCVDQKTWNRFLKAHKSIVDASNSYKNAVAAGQCS